MSVMRSCSRTGCYAPAVSTLTYVYADATAVIGPLAQQASPHAYDLCARHTQSFTAPRGWQVVRLQMNFEAPEPSSDDLDALAQAIRQASRHPRQPERQPSRRESPEAPEKPSAGPSLHIVRGDTELPDGT
ncbi:MAG: DUF3499 domain-containing protein [Actinomycetaceae bacterium]|nr:DUF3499 domain-containing protein [Actinomycetaceae bacterium]MDU0969703.1 DUF3499 domain-containing protein [Actinomycetaceae bacterium]